MLMTPLARLDTQEATLARRREPVHGDALLDRVQRQTLRYFWDFAHPASGLARMRSNVTANYTPDVVATGGSGFGIVAIIVGVERGWIAREAAVERLLTMFRFLEGADRFHGAFPHLLDGATGRTIPFFPYGRADDGGDIVETSYLCVGLLCARQYFDRATPEERELRARADALWRGVEWDWYTRDGVNVLYWHWSPSGGWGMNHDIRGWNECLIAYVLAASSPRHAIRPEVYHRGWPQGFTFRNRREYYDIWLPLGPDYGGPLFFAQFSFVGLDPRGLEDRYADYWRQNLAHTLINREHCVRNPRGYAGYGRDCWGLTAPDDEPGRCGGSPEEDEGVIRPTAALSSFPYAPEHSMAALEHFYHDLGDQIWGEHGFCDAFCEQDGWRADFCMAVNQGPIVAMIENHRTGLPWRLFMSCPEVGQGLRALGFASPHLGRG